MSHGWKEDSMLVKRLFAYTHLSSTVSEIYQVIGRKLPHFYTPLLFSGSAGGDPVRISRRYTQNENEWAIVWRRKHDYMFSRFDTVPACDGRTDRRTDGQTDRQTDRRPAYS